MIIKRTLHSPTHGYFMVPTSIETDVAFEDFLTWIPSTLHSLELLQKLVSQWDSMEQEIKNLGAPGTMVHHFGDWSYRIEVCKRNPVTSYLLQFQRNDDVQMGTVEFRISAKALSKISPSEMLIMAESIKLMMCDAESGDYFLVGWMVDALKQYIDLDKVTNPYCTTIGPIELRIIEETGEGEQYKLFLKVED